MTNPFRGSPIAPHHLSVGAILLNDENKVACHFYEESKIRNYPANFYALLHETVEPNETLEQAVIRGIHEEFSMTATFERYAGSLVFEIPHNHARIEKTTVYFVCRLTEINSERDLSDPEAISEIRWMNIGELIKIMKDQREALGLGDAVDESKILEDVQKYYL